MESILRSPYFVILLILWSLSWKGVALWRAAQRKHVTWFVLLLILNTAGILEFLYLTFLYRYDFWNSKILAAADAYRKQKKPRTSSKKSLQ